MIYLENNMSIKDIALYVWQAPQNILGVLALNYYKPKSMYELEDGTEIYYSNRINGGLTLGKHVFVAATHYRNKVEISLLRDTVRHNAIGHTRQSRLLGWFYLPAVLGSLAVGKMLGKKKYEFGMERWADRISNTIRK